MAVSRSEAGMFQRNLEHSVTAESKEALQESLGHVIRIQVAA